MVVQVAPSEGPAVQVRWGFIEAEYKYVAFEYMPKCNKLHYVLLQGKKA